MTIPQKLKINIGRALNTYHLRQYGAKGSRLSGRPLVVGLLTSPSGLGEGARLYLDALESEGYEPAYLDVTQNFSGHISTLNLPHSRDDDGLGPILLHVNPHEFAHLIRLKLIPNLENRYRVGLWAWEQLKIPLSWRPMAHLIDEFWGFSSFLTDLYAEKFKTPSTYIPYPCALQNRGAIMPKAPRPTPFKVLTSFSSLSSLERKNPEGAVSAFLKAFPDDPHTSLTIQSSTPMTETERHLLGPDPRITLLDKPFTDPALADLFRSHHVFLSMHRAEGFGLSIAKSLALGVPAIFSDHSGARDFTASPFSYGVPCQQVPVRSRNPHYRTRYGRWGEPDLDIAAQALQEVRDLSPSRRSQLSQASVNWWQAHYGPENFSQRIRQTPFAKRLNTLPI